MSLFRKKMFVYVILASLLNIYSIANAGNILDYWRKVKTEFENNTKKKKPTEKQWGIFRKSTGLEDAIKEIEKAKTVAQCKTAVAKFDAKRNEYVKLLKANQIDSGNINYKAEIDKMILELDNVWQMGADKMNYLSGQQEAAEKAKKKN